MIVEGVWNSQYGDFELKYHDALDFSKLPVERIRNVVGVCFCGDMLLIAHNTKGYWGFVGGVVEKNEQYEDTLKREVQEESNMKVVNFKPIGYQIAAMTDGDIYQLRYVCSVVPYGEFVRDPDLGIDKIKLIDPADVKQYFDWGKISDRIMEQALVVKETL